MNEESVDVSVPTDLTVTSHGESEDDHTTIRRHARELQGLASAKAELQRLVEKQKLELESKDAQLAALSQQLQARVVRVVAQKDDQISSKQIQLNSLELELRRTKEELSTIRERAARELAQLTQKCSVFQQNQKRLTTRQEVLRKSLADLQLSQEEFTKLRQTPAEELSLQQYTALRVYEMVWPLRLKLNELEAVRSSLESALAAKDADLQTRIEEHVRQRKYSEELQRKCEQYAHQLLNLKEEQRSEDFKVQNYSRVKTERDQLQEEKMISSKKISELELVHATLKKEHSILENNHSELKGKQRKQEFELRHCQEQAVDLKNKLGKISEDMSSANKQLHLERDRCGSLHEKYLAARGDVAQLTESSLDQQHELKLLRESLQTCKLQCSGLQEKVALLSQQNEETNMEVERARLKLTVDTQALNAQVQDLRMSLSTASKNRDTLMEENSRLHQKTHELEALCQEERSRRKEETNALSKDLQELKKALSAYDGLPEELERTMKAAAVLPEGDTSKLLERLLPAARLQGDRAIEQCIQLTRRVLQLEGENMEACTTIHQLTEALDHLRNTTSSYKTALGLAGQPSANLLERIASQEDQISSLQTALNHHTRLKTTLAEENKTLSNQVIHLKHELEEAVIETSEMSAIKKQLETLLQHTSSSLPRPTATAPPRKEQPIKTGEPQPSRSLPGAIIITKQSRHQAH